MRRLFIIIAAMAIATSSLYSKLPPTINDLQANAPQDALIINISGTKQADGFFSPAQRHVIERLPRANYLQNSIHIKTRNHLNLRKDKTAELSPSILSGSNLLSVLKVRAIASEYSEYQMLSKDANGIGRIYELSYQNPIDPYDACIELMKNPEIEYACPIFIHHTNYQPNDASFTQQYALAKINAENAWEISKGSKTVKIAIVDSGTDTDHEDLKANMVAGGKDFVGDISQSDANYSNWKEDNDPKPNNSNNTHGTHVAGCANAVTNNGIGIASISMNCTFFAVKCGADNDDVSGIHRGYEAILYAAQQGADVINCSWGGPGYSPVGQEVINQAVALGSVVVVSSGNSTDNIDKNGYYPACYNNVVCVGATNSSDKAAYFSNFGHLNTVYAPGQGIYASLPGNNYNTKDGTSMSAPITSGLAALVKTVFPNYTPQQIRQQLRSTCDNVISTGALRPMYYGRINAYKAVSFNTAAFPDRKIPGCDMIAYKIGTTDALVNNLSQEVKFTIENFLAPTSSNFKVKITPLDYFIKVVEKEYSVGALASLSQKELTMNVQLTQDNPWFSGYANVLLTFEDGDYVDYKLFQIPIRVPSDNSYSTVSTFPDSYSTTFNNSHSISKNIFWAVGASNNYYGTYYRYATGSKKFNFTGANPNYAIYGFDDKNAFMGNGPSNGNAQLFKTTNGGDVWTPIPVSTITGFVNDIHFFNANDGIFLGDPKDSKWGIATTNNAGETWTHNQTVPAPVTGEALYVGATANFNDNVWFGTSTGRVFRSMNKGLSWTASYAAAGNYVMNLAFTSKDNGLAIYTGATSSADRWVAKTTNGGQTWTSTDFNFAAKGVAPVKLYSPLGSGIFIALCKNGEILATHDLGVSWRPVLSKNTPSVSTGAGAVEGNRVRMWLAGAEISTLDFDMPLANVTRSLTVDANSLNFDSVKVSAYKTITLNLSNAGNSRVTISSINFNGENSSDFSTLFGTSTSVEAEGNGIVRVKFVPSAAGLRSAKMQINSDASTELIEIDLQGFGYDSEIKALSTNGVSFILFDSTIVGNSSTKSFAIKNTGEAGIVFALNLDANNPEYKIMNQNIPTQLAPNEEFTIDLQFNPTKIGISSNTLTISNDGDPAIINIGLAGVGYDPTSIIEAKSFSLANVFPNPARDNASCVVAFENYTRIKATIVDLNGREIADVFAGYAHQGENIIAFQTNDLTNGTYFLKVESAEGAIFRKFIVE